MSSNIEELIPPDVIGAPRQRAASALEFYDRMARELSELKFVGVVDGSDFLLAQLAANLGIAHDPVVRNKQVDAGEEIFQVDILPLLPNSNLRWYIQLSSASSTVQLRTKFSENDTLDGLILDGAPLTVNVPRVFDIPSSRTRRYNLFPTVDTQIDIAFAVEFRIGL